MKSVTLIGMMGAGKTTCAKLLAEETGCSLFDVDKIIESDMKCSISEIFETRGEDFFRNLEQEVILHRSKPENMIIATGGCVFENPRLREFLIDISVVVYLKAQPETIYERIKTDLTRPLLKNNMNIERIRSLISLREKNYLKADYVIETDGKTIGQIVSEITGVL